MNAGEFAKRRARIEHEHGRRKGYAARALQALVREARAIVIIVRGRIAGWRMPSGQVVCRKRRYRTEPEAILELANVRRDPRTPRIPGRCYLCPHCNGWHLTSQPPEHYQ